MALIGYWKIRCNCQSRNRPIGYRVGFATGLIKSHFCDGEMLIARMDKSHLSTDTKTYYFSLFYDLGRSPSFLGSLLLKNGAECLKSLKAIIIRELQGLVQFPSFS